MKKWTFATKRIIVNFGLLCIGGYSLADELSLQQVIDAVNFGNMSIDSAELKADLYISPRVLPKPIRERMEVELQQLKNQYQITSNPVEKQTLAQHIKIAEDVQNSPPLPRYYEYSVIFRRNNINDGNNIIDWLKSQFSYRVFRVNQASKHADPNFLKSIPLVVRSNYIGQEIRTLISNGESEVTLTINDRLDNNASFKEPSAHILTFLFLGGRVIVPINPDRVIEFQPATQNGTTIYFIEYTPDIPGFAMAGVDTIKSTRIQVNPSKGFSVTKMEELLHIGGKKVLKSAVQFDDFKLYSQGIWYPTSIQLTEYQEGQKVVEHLYDIYEADFNISIPHNFFHVQENEIRRLGIEILRIVPK